MKMALLSWQVELSSLGSPLLFLTVVMLLPTIVWLWGTVQSNLAMTPQRVFNLQPLFNARVRKDEYG